MTGAGPTLLLPGVNDVVLHTCDLDVVDPAAAATLAGDELERAARFRFEVDRARYERGRAWLRSTLGAYLGIEPIAVQFAYGPQRKPSIDGVAPLHFNLAHCANLAVLAIARFEIGIDLETLRPGFASDEIAERFFAPAEVTMLRSLPVHEQEAAFFRCWTRKESYLKANGGGLSIPLDSFTVTFATRAEPARMLWVESAPTEPDQWSIVDVSEALAPVLGASAVAAVAARHPIESVTVNPR